MFCCLFFSHCLRNKHPIDGSWQLRKFVQKKIEQRKKNKTYSHIQTIFCDAEEKTATRGLVHYLLSCRISSMGKNVILIRCSTFCKTRLMVVAVPVWTLPGIQNWWHCGGFRVFIDRRPIIFGWCTWFVLCFLVPFLSSMSQVHQFYLHMVPSFAKYARTILWNITDDSIGEQFPQNCMWFYPWLFDVGVSIHRNCMLRVYVCQITVHFLVMSKWYFQEERTPGPAFAKKGNGTFDLSCAPLFELNDFGALSAHSHEFHFKPWNSMSYCTSKPMIFHRF